MTNTRHIQTTSRHMRSHRDLHFTLLATAMVALLVCSVAVVSAGETVSFDQDEGKTFTARCGGQVLWQFNFAQDLSKPFFHPVAVSQGSVITWNSPPDHRWHHGLWFCWKYINRVNYWELNRQTGKPDGQTNWQVPRIETTADGKAVIRMQLQYRPGDVDPVLTEDRTITVSPPASDGSYLFDWRCAFTAGSEKVVLDRTPLPNEPGGELYGGYAGLSVRIAKELTEREAMTTQGPVEFSSQSRFRGKANAMDYAGQIAGQELGIAICDHPQNLNHPSPWYAIRSNVMSYFSPAVICYAPHALQPGESFTLRYRVIVHRDKWDANRLTKEYEQFVSDSSSRTQ